MKNKANQGFLVVILLILGPFLFTGNSLIEKIEKYVQTDEGNWSIPVLLYEVKDTGSIQKPYITSDLFGGIHVFWTLKDIPQIDKQLIYYSRLDGSSWFPAIDIVADSQADSVSAATDSLGFLHLVWSGIQGIQYTQVPIASGESIKEWSRPQLLLNANRNSSIISDGKGYLYFAAPGKDSNGIYFLSYDLKKRLWSLPRKIAKTSKSNSAADFVRIAVGGDGSLHVVWTELTLPEGWPPIGIFYANSTDGGQTWSVPIQIAGEGNDQINVIVVGDQTIHVAWNGIVGIGGRYHRWSPDGGKTWSQTNVVIPEGLGGTEGPPQLIVDQAGVIHFLTTYNACAWYTYWQNQRWDKPVCISGKEAMASKYIEEAVMTLSEGNKLHVVFWDGRARLWYTTRQTAALSVAPEPLPTFLRSQNNKVEVTQTSQDISSSVSQTTLPVARSQFTGWSLGPGLIVFISILPIILILAGILLLKSLAKR